MPVADHAQFGIKGPTTQHVPYVEDMEDLSSFEPEQIIQAIRFFNVVCPMPALSFCGLPADGPVLAPLGIAPMDRGIVPGGTGGLALLSKHWPFWKR